MTKANRLFAPDLYRSFVLGFGTTALVLAGTTIEDFGPFGPELAPPAHAAAVEPEPTEAPHLRGEVSDEFVIAPIDHGVPQ